MHFYVTSQDRPFKIVFPAAKSDRLFARRFAAESLPGPDGRKRNIPMSGNSKFWKHPTHIINDPEMGPVVVEAFNREINDILAKEAGLGEFIYDNLIEVKHPRRAVGWTTSIRCGDLPLWVGLTPGRIDEYTHVFNVRPDSPFRAPLTPYITFRASFIYPEGDKDDCWVVMVHDFYFGRKFHTGEKDRPIRPKFSDGKNGYALSEDQLVLFFPGHPGMI